MKSRIFLSELGWSPVTEQWRHIFLVWCSLKSLQCFDAVGGRQEGHPVCKKTDWWVASVVICLERGADLHMAQVMPLPLTSLATIKSRLVLPFWYRITRVVLEKRAVKRVCVCGAL